MNSALATCISKWHKKACGRFISEPTLRICQECLSRASKQLTEIPVLYRELGQSLSVRRKAFPFIEGSRASGGNSGLVNEGLIDTRKNITDVIISWANLVAEERQLSTGAGQSPGVDDLSVFLLRHLRWLASHPAAPDFVREIDAIHSDGLARQRSLGIHDMGNYTCGAPCCHARLRIVIHPEGTGEPLELRCDEGHSWKPDQWLGLKQQEEGSAGERPPTRVPTKVAAAAAGVSEATIRQWVRRGKLTRYGTGSRAEFDLDELAALSKRT